MNYISHMIDDGKLPWSAGSKPAQNCDVASTKFRMIFL